MSDSELPYQPSDSFNGGELDCGNGLLLLIRQHIDPLQPGQLLEIVSLEASVEADLPSWCRLTGNELVHVHHRDRERHFLVSKGPFAPPPAGTASAPANHEVWSDTDETRLVKGKTTTPASRDRSQMAVTQPVVTPYIPSELPPPAPAPKIEALSVLSVGSWPRPRWLLRALHERLEGRLAAGEFEDYADDAVRLAVSAQLDAGVDVVSDGEQRRDNYASFVGGILQNCQLIPITDLLAYVDDPHQFEKELRALDVPAGEVRHPAVFGPLGRREPLAVHEARFVKSLTDNPVKVSLPGPYLLTRTMWMECISDRAYTDRESLAADVVRVLREEIHELLAAGVSLVQLDEPVLTEVLYGQAGQGGRTFMCGALGERGAADQELRFAADLLHALTDGLPDERLAVHVCRGNWTPDETKALAGDYTPLVALLRSLNVGLVVLELCTTRAGELEALVGLRDDQRLGVGVINQKHQQLEPLEEVVQRARRAIDLFGRERILLNTDCGFATFADNPIVDSKLAEAKMRRLAEARETLHSR